MRRMILIGIVTIALAIVFSTGQAGASRPSPLGTPVPLTPTRPTPTKVLLFDSSMATPTTAATNRGMRAIRVLRPDAPRLYFFSWGAP